MKPTKRVIVTTTHRLEYISILEKYLQQQKNSYDEWHIWPNTNDTNIIDELKKINNASVIIPPNTGNPSDGVNNLHYWYKEDSRESNTDYIKFDDDIVWLEPNFIDKTFNYREQYRNDYFLIFANIVNNAILSNIQVRLGNYKWDNTCWYYYLDPVGWGSGPYAENLHRQLLEHIKNNTYTQWYFKKWILDMREQVSINAICWTGEDFAKVVPSMNSVDEYHINNYGPTFSNKHSAIFGDLLCSHYSFYVQKPYLDSTSILEDYKKLADSV